ncbi:piezo-type mechanosensitive ion channel component 2-like%2C partial [Xyrichtys novacula]|uniref:Piezo-type mechanosensitive ion channel component 2-like, partial n=1 Tax=Xyrichtys novacula TaxID=13765 RepID=A0AAV1H6Z8_XYRNO|nr:piezo-type mechanosensitive ion channel component 2-like%2C partial [Xyrichtys novacula]
MIATGGLLRINARRQDSLKNKTQKPHPHKKRNKKKRRSEVVVVKGKLKLFSVSGLVAALGILVLLVGGVMAALGYWPRDGLFFSTRPQEGTAMASVSSGGSTPDPADLQEGQTGKDGDEEPSRSGEEEGGGDEEREVFGFNQTENVNGTIGRLQKSFLEDFLDRYLYSDRLKVFGPLIMGIGIFLFICANAVLHENRDKKTKVINLRDIYSTVIDLHSLRKPNASSATSSNPLNGLINYVQSKSLETKPRAYPASLKSRREGPGDGGGGLSTRQLLPGSNRGGGGACDGDEGDGVFSIYQERQETPSPPSSSSDRHSLPPSFSPPRPSTCWTSFQRDTLNSFTLPLRRPRPSFPRRRHSAREGTSRAWGSGEEEEEQRMEGEDHRQEEEEGVYPGSPPPLDSSTPPQPRPAHSSAASSSLHKGAPEGSQALLLLSCSSLTPSHLSLSSLSHLLTSSSPTPAPPCRRRSLPSGCSAAGYSKLTQGEGESFESTEMTTYHVTSQGRGQRSGEMALHREFSNDSGTFRMVSQVESGVKKNKDEG